jgi:AcrR family transcriptional regulator
MGRVPQLLDLERRIPRQQRAQESCAAIFEAAAQILLRDGMAGLSTNRIAERAGVSIGTLYQYFPNKQAVLLAMGRRDIEETSAAVAAAVAAAAAAGELPGPRVIHCLVERFSARPQVRRVLMETVFSQQLHAELATALEAMTRLLVQHGPPLAAATPAAVFVLTRAVMGVLRGAVMEDAAPEPALLEQELLRLARSYLGVALVSG